MKGTLHILRPKFSNCVEILSLIIVLILITRAEPEKMSRLSGCILIVDISECTMFLLEFTQDKSTATYERTNCIYQMNSVAQYEPGKSDSDVVFCLQFLCKTLTCTLHLD